jgi:RNA polymerase sigma-70 factor (ECF subfamily)
MRAATLALDPPVADAALASVGTEVQLPDLHTTRLPAPPVLDAESRAWLSRLRACGAPRQEALAELRQLLVRAARFEVHRRRATLPHIRGGDLDDVAEQAADDALMAILAKLNSFRGDSRFTTWAYKFALLEAGVRLRRLAWQGREVPLEDEGWSVLADRAGGPAEGAQTGELLTAIRAAIEHELTPHQRQVLVALALNDVPIDVLAERLDTSRGALYKTLHDARRKLRAHLSAQGLPIGADLEKEHT